MSFVQGSIPGKNKILENKYRLTPQRKSVLLALAGSKSGDHLTAEEIYYLAKKRTPRIGLATVYRTLELFTRLSIVQRLILEDGRSRYELKGEVPHNHLICLSCGKIFESESGHLQDLLPARPDFKVTSSEVHIFGYCEGCRQR